MPTILDAAGIEPPADGRRRRRSSRSTGESLLGDVRRRRRRPRPATSQYFEMLGSRAIFHDGWKATTDHVGGRSQSSARTSRAAATSTRTTGCCSTSRTTSPSRAISRPSIPSGCSSCIDVWWAEAERNHVFPLDDSFIGRAGAMFRPAVRPAVPHRVPARRRSRVRGRAAAAGCRLRRHGARRGRRARANGILFALGNWTNGCAWYLLDGTLVHVFNGFGNAHRIVATSRVPAGAHELVVPYTREGGAPHRHPRGRRSRGRPGRAPARPARSGGRSAAPGSRSASTAASPCATTTPSVPRSPARCTTSTFDDPDARAEGRHRGTRRARHRAQRRVAPPDVRVLRMLAGRHSASSHLRASPWPDRDRRGAGRTARRRDVRPVAARARRRSPRWVAPGPPHAPWAGARDRGADGSGRAGAEEAGVEVVGGGGCRRGRVRRRRRSSRSRSRATARTRPTVHAGRRPSPTDPGSDGSGTATAGPALRCAAARAARSPRSTARRSRSTAPTSPVTTSTVTVTTTDDTKVTETVEGTVERHRGRRQRRRDRGVDRRRVTATNIVDNGDDAAVDVPRRRTARTARRLGDATPRSFPDGGPGGPGAPRVRRVRAGAAASRPVRSRASTAPRSRSRPSTGDTVTVVDDGRHDGLGHQDDHARRPRGRRHRAASSARPTVRP